MLAGRSRAVPCCGGGRPAVASFSSFRVLCRALFALGIPTPTSRPANETPLPLRPLKKLQSLLFRRGFRLRLSTAAGVPWRLVRCLREPDHRHCSLLARAWRGPGGWRCLGPDPRRISARSRFTTGQERERESSSSAERNLSARKACDCREGSTSVLPSHR